MINNLKQILYTYTNIIAPGEKMCSEYMSQHKESLVFDKDRHSIYTQNQEFGYIGDTVQSIALRNESNTNSSIVTLTVEDGVITLSQYSAPLITSIKFYNNDTLINPDGYTPGSLQPLAYNQTLSFNKVDVKVSSATDKCGFQINEENSAFGPERIDIEVDAIGTTHTFSRPYKVTENINGELENNLGSLASDLSGNITYTCASVITVERPTGSTGISKTVKIYAGVQDAKQLEVVPHSSTTGYIEFGWYYVLYYSHTLYNTDTASADMDLCTHDGNIGKEYIEPHHTHVYKYNSTQNVKFNMDQGPGTTNPMYVYIPNTLTQGNFLQFLWNGNVYSTPPEDVVIKIDNIDYNIYYIDENFTVNVADEITLDRYVS